MSCWSWEETHHFSLPKSPRGVFKFLDLSPDSSTWGEGQPSRKKVRMPCNWMPCKQHSMEHGMQNPKQKDLTFFVLWKCSSRHLPAVQHDTLLHLHCLGCSVDLPYGCLVVPFFGFERPKWKLDKDELQPHTIQGFPYPSTVHVLSWQWPSCSLSLLHWFGYVKPGPTTVVQTWFKCFWEVQLGTLLLFYYI